MLLSNSAVLVSNIEDISMLDGISSEECKDKLLFVRQKEKDVIASNNAINVIDKSMGNRFINNNIKQILRCFNAEYDNNLINISAKNIDNIKNKIYNTDGVHLVCFTIVL